MSYEGWKNYETWNAHMYPMQDEAKYHLIMASRPFTPEKAEHIMRELYPNGTPDMKGPEDFEKVDWEEIAEAFNE